MKKKIIVAIFIAIGTAGMLVTKIWTPYFFDAVILLLSFIGAYEIAQAMNKMDRPTPIPLVVAFPALLYGGICAGYILNWRWQYFLYLYLLIILAMSIVSLISQMFVPREEGESVLKEAWDRTVNTVFCFIYPTVCLSMLYLINHFNQQLTISALSLITESNFGIFFMLLVFVITMVSDSAAMMLGTFIKGPKLCPKISPNKTISGAVSGLVFATIGAVALYLIFATNDAFVAAAEYLGFGIVWAAIAGAVGSLFSQIGDLLASAIKRKAGIKDYGKIFPGHGGVMDRVDALMVNAVWMAIVMAIIIIKL